MADGAKKRMFTEDYFELDDFKEAQARKIWTAEFRKKNKKIVNLFTVIIIIAGCVMGWFLFTVAQSYIDQWRTKKIVEEGKAAYNERLTNKANAVAGEPVEILVNGTPAGVPDPNLVGGKTILPEIQAQRGLYNNNDVVGFLIIADTSIYMPVVQGKDNEYYLTHDAKKNNNVSGWIFVDANSGIDPLGCNTIIYGHNVRDDNMFHDLRYYQEAEFFEKHRYISLTTLYEETMWEIFTFYSAAATDGYVRLGFADEGEYTAYLEKAKSRSKYDTGVSVSAEDQILTLSTCTNLDDDSRFVVQAKRVYKAGKTD